MSTMPHSCFEACIITLDEPNSVYYPGQKIFGKVNFELNNPLKYMNINVIFKGEANVFWTEEEQETYGGVSRRKLVKYSGHEEYLNYTQCISGGIGVVSVLPTGGYSLEFQHQVPFNAPSSFEGEKGQITYTITAVLVHKDNVMENSIKKFNVVAPLDMNSEEIKRPIKLHFDEVYSCSCFCSPRPLTVTLRAPHSGYAPGETILFTVEAHNETSVEVSKIILEVVKRMRYLSQQPPSTVEPPEESVATKTSGPILSGTQREYFCDLKLPDFVALNFDNCGIIDVGYFLKVTLKVSGCNDDLFDETELCIGLTPVGSTRSVRVTHPMPECIPNAPIPQPDVQQNVGFTQAQISHNPPNRQTNNPVTFGNNSQAVYNPGTLNNSTNNPGTFGDSGNAIPPAYVPFPGLPSLAMPPRELGSQSNIPHSPPPSYSSLFSPSAPPAPQS